MLLGYCASLNQSLIGQHIDGPQNGPAPPPWSIPAQPSQLFTPQEAHIEVPHTATVKVCAPDNSNHFKKGASMTYAIITTRHTCIKYGFYGNLIICILCST